MKITARKSRIAAPMLMAIDEGAADDGKFAEKGAEGGGTGNGEKAGEEKPARTRQAAQPTSHLLSQFLLL